MASAAGAVPGYLLDDSHSWVNSRNSVSGWKLPLGGLGVILAGLRSEEMGKEKNTRENKSQCNVNTKDIAELSLTTPKTLRNPWKMHVNP